MLSNDSSAAANAPPTALLAHHRDLILQVCRGLLGHRQDAEDAAQDTFVRALKSWHRLDPQRPLLPWLRQIAVNRCRTGHTRRINTSQIQHPATDTIACPHAGAGQTAEQLERQETLRAVREVLATLPPDWADAFWAVQSGRESHRQVARRIGRPVGTVKTWVHRTRLMLIDQFVDAADPDGDRR